MPIHADKTAREINIEGSKNVFQAAAKAGIKKIVYSSSCAAYGAWPDNPELITENHPRHGMPDFYYSWSKAKVEEFLDQFEKEHPEIVVTRLRPCIFLGPSINNVMKDIVGLPMSIRIIDRKFKIQFVWDEDVVDALYLAIKKDYHGAYNIAGDGYVTMEDVAEIMGVPALPTFYHIARMMTWLLWNLRIFKNMSPGWVKMGADPVIIGCDKARREMGWKASLDSRGAFARFVKEMRPILQAEKAKS
jgi:UDP-glucose 4-epimerase